MAALFGNIEQFNPKCEIFSEYVERLGFYFEANSVIDINKKKAIFLTLIGPSQFRLLKDLTAPSTIAEKSFDELCVLLKSHHEPKPPKFLQRTKFENRSRNPGESVKQYIVVLRNLSEHCDFGETLEDRLCERFVRGINDERIQRRLLSETDLKLNRAVEIAVAITQSTEGARELDTKSINVVRKKIQNDNNQRKSGQTKKCHKCLGDHAAHSCPYKDFKCHSCGMKGHIIKACRNVDKRQSQQVSNQHKPKFGSQKLLQVREESETDPNYDLFTVSSGSSHAVCKLSSSVSGSPAIRRLEVNDVSIDFQIDTGAACTVINHGDFEKHFKNLELGESSATLQTYSGQGICVVGQIKVNVKYDDSEFELPLIVAEGYAPPLLGRNWLAVINPYWVEVLTLSSENSSINSLLDKYESVFNNDAGCLKDHKVKLHVDASITPRYMKARQPPYALRDQIQAELSRLENSGVIEKVQFSDWATPIVPILKKDNTIRICGDYKVTVNKIINQDEHPIPKLEDLTAKLAGGVKFSSIDLKLS